MKNKLILLLACVAILSSGCTANERMKKFGGTSTVEIPAGQKLVNVTWKELNLWVLTKPMTTNDTAETYTFKEHSNMGIIQGTVIFKENKL